ncbi:MAG: efflux RND transporter periplasmic adaptor subunit [Rhodocyclaceae bacterium]|nr:efflux RND transporter periplasmic adaptor subunit [Rhodocyclaceae bacterium]
MQARPADPSHHRRHPSGRARPSRMSALLVMGLALLNACSEPPPPAEPAIRSVKTMIVEARAGERLRRFSGRVAAATTAVLSFPVAGTVSRIAVKAGDTVKRGQVLASIDSRPLELEVEGTRADLRKAESVLEQRSGVLRRNEELLAKGFIGEASIEQSRADVSAARSDVAYRKSRLDRATLSLQDTRMVAPFDGVIGERLVQANEEVGAGKPVLSVLGEDRFEVEVSVPEVAIAQLAVGMPAKVVIGALPELLFDGSVREIGRVAGAGNVYPVKVALADPPSQLRAGMTAEVSIAASGSDEEREGFLVPVSALKPGSEPGKGDVFVFDSDAGIARMTPVRILSVRDNDAVVTGLEPGHRVIVAGVAFLSDGQAVRLMATSVR